MVMKSILVSVADSRELSGQVLAFLKVHNITILYTGIGKDQVVRALATVNLSQYDEIWNIGSVGSVLPLYSVFEVGGVYSGDGVLRQVLSESKFFIKTSDSFTSVCPDDPPYSSLDMELSHIVDFVRDYTSDGDHVIKLRAFKYVSDNMTEDFTIDDWYKTIDETAFIVSEPLIKLLKGCILC